MSQFCRGVYSTTFHHELRNERFTLISFIGFTAILSTLQPYQICICNRKYSKWTFSNGPHMMGKRFMANLHASLDSTWKSRFSQNFTSYGGVYSTTFGTKLRYEAKKMSKSGGGGHSTTCDTTVSNTFKKNFKLLELVLLSRVLRCINIELFLPVSLPRNIQNYSQNQ